MCLLRPITRYHFAMLLRRAQESDITELMSWFETAASCQTWGGPAFEYPYTRDSFVRDLHWPGMDSFVLTDESDEVSGFGQFYEKYSRVHLARIVVNANSRGSGNGVRLVQGLVEEGVKKLTHREASLYVYKDNEAAIACYQRAGFVEAAHPVADENFQDCFFMVLNPSAN